MSNQGLAEELHKPIIKNCENRKVPSCFMDNIWGPVLSRCNYAIISLCVFDIFSKYIGAVPFKDKKGITITQAFLENEVT